MVPARYWRYMELHFENGHEFDPKQIKTFQEQTDRDGRRIWLWGHGKGTPTMIREIEVTETPAGAKFIPTT